MSRVVYIRRRDTNTNIPKHVYAESKRKIGSCFTQSGDIIKGLSFSEEQKLLPSVLGMSHDNVNFFKAVKDFYTELTVEVALGKGTPLEVELDPQGNPTNLMDYIRYKFCLAHPYVSQHQDELKSKHKYFIYDTKSEEDKNYSALEMRKTAYKEFIKLTAKEDKMDHVLRVLGIDPRSLSSEQKEMKLESSLESEPEAFFEVVTDKHLEDRAFVEQCISTGVIRKVGNTLLNGDENLGDSMEECILFIRDKKNSGVLVTLKARLKEFS